MKQTNFINQFTNNLIEKDYLMFAFLEGSFKRQTNDEFSNVDLYISFKDIINEIDDFILEQLTMYKKIIYFKRNDNVYTCIFNDNLFVRIHVIGLFDLNNFKAKNDIMVIYDLNNYLDNIKNYSLSLSDEEKGNYIDNIAINCLEFTRFYLRNDLPIMLSIAIKVFDDYSILLRSSKDNKNAKLGNKEILSYLNQNERVEHINLLKKMNISSLKDAILTILKNVTKIINELSINVNNYYDYDLLMYVYNYLSKI